MLLLIDFSLSSIFVYILFTVFYKILDNTNMNYFPIAKKYSLPSIVGVHLYCFTQWERLQRPHFLLFLCSLLDEPTAKVLRLCNRWTVFSLISLWQTFVDKQIVSIGKCLFCSCNNFFTEIAIYWENHLYPCPVHNRSNKIVARIT